VRPISDFYRDPARPSRRWLPPSARLSRPRASALAFALLILVAGIALGLRSRPAEGGRVSIVERVEFVERYEREHGAYPAAVAGVRYETDCAPQNGVCRGHASHHAHLASGVDDVVLRPR